MVGKKKREHATLDEGREDLPEPQVQWPATDYHLIHFDPHLACQGLRYG